MNNFAINMLKRAFITSCFLPLLLQAFAINFAGLFNKPLIYLFFLSLPILLLPSGEYFILYYKFPKTMNYLISEKIFKKEILI